MLKKLIQYLKITIYFTRQCIYIFSTIESTAIFINLTHKYILKSRPLHCIVVQVIRFFPRRWSCEFSASWPRTPRRDFGDIEKCVCGISKKLCSGKSRNTLDKRPMCIWTISIHILYYAHSLAVERRCFTLRLGSKS